MLSYNPGLFNAPEHINILRWVVIFTASMRLYVFAIAKRSPITTHSVLFGCFVITAFLTSVLYGYNVKVALLKLFSFAFVGLSILLAFQVMTTLKPFLLAYLYTYFVVVIGSSLPLVSMDVGFYLNGNGFQGILSHPQAYGIFTSVFLALLSGLWLSRNPSTPLPWHFRFALFTGYLTMVLSMARTGVFALAIAFFGVLLFSMVAKQSWLIYFSRVIVRKSVFVIVILVSAISIVYFYEISRHMEKFILKSKYIENEQSKSALASRSQLIELSWNNFKKYPWTGIGFGLPSVSYWLNPKSDNMFGIPIEASIEKGFLPTAVLEENGIVGGVVFLLFTIALFRRVARQNEMPSMLLLATCYAVNLGEYVFFSMGYIGLLMFVLVGYSTMEKKP